MTSLGSLSQLLDELAPATGVEQPAWNDVLARAELLALVAAARPAPATAAEKKKLLGRLRGRPLLAALVIVAVAFVPVSAFAVVKNDPWWFLRFPNLLNGEGPAKGTHVVVLEQGTWDGQRWMLTAYRSVRGSLCTQFTEQTPSGTSTPEGVGGCGAEIGATVRDVNGHRRVTISSMSGGLGQIRYAAGPVVTTAETVRITLADGTVINTRTFAAPSALGTPVRFFVAQLPSPAASSAQTCKQRVTAENAIRLQKLIGFDGSGKIVASLRLAARPPGLLQTLCKPHRNHAFFPPNLPAAARPLKTVEQLTAPYGARATLVVGAEFRMAEARFQPNGRLKHFTQLSRCWEIRFSNGQSQGGCTPVVVRNEPELSPEVQHAGRDTFLIVQTPPRTGPAIARVSLKLANGHVLDAKPVDGIVLFGIPRDALSTTRSQRGFLTGYDNSGRQVSFYNSFGHVRYKRQAVYYRSCPLGSSCYD